MKKILVIEDEPEMRRNLLTILKLEKFQPVGAENGRAGLAAVQRDKPDLILCDVMMPELDGFEVAKRLGEQRSDIPILFLTARDTTDDKVRGLTIGGDDYMTKPFSVEELLARIGTILKRSGRGRKEDGPLTFLDLELDDETREVFRDGNAIELTDTEFRLLRYLMNNPRRVLTRGQILDHVWEYDFAGDARVLETYISYLRRKLDLYGPGLIITVRGVGYALREPKA